MVSPRSLFAVVIACIAQGALSYQHLVFFAPRDWDKVELLQYKVERHHDEGYNPHEDAPEDGWVKWPNAAGGTSFAHKIAVQVHDKVSVRMTTIEGDTKEETHEIVDVRSEGNKGQTISWKVGSVPLFSLLENVRHTDVWTTWFAKLREIPEGDNFEEKMSSLFEESKKEHDGWHILMMMDHVPSGSVKLTYKTTEGKTRETQKTVDRGGLFAAWSLDNVAGDLELFVDGQSKVKMQIKTASFMKQSFSLTQLSGVESHVYILPFNSHKQSDVAWRKVLEHHDSGTDPFWDKQTSSWESSKLQQLTTDAASGTVAAAVLPADPRVLDAAVDGPTRMVVITAVVALLLLVAGYCFCRTAPVEDGRGCSMDSTTLSNDPPLAPSMLGDAWPQESVRELVPPASVV